MVSKESDLKKTRGSWKFVPTKNFHPIFASARAAFSLLLPWTKHRLSPFLIVTDTVTSEGNDPDSGGNPADHFQGVEDQTDQCRFQLIRRASHFRVRFFQLNRRLTRLF